MVQLMSGSLVVQMGPGQQCRAVVLPCQFRLLVVLKMVSMGRSG